ncbi:MAG: N-acetyl-gamma-glutamyl-phosphate reductase [Candidatus Omnitrophota bacterium]
MLKVGIVGITGYTGQELIRILLKHPKVKISGLFSTSSYNKKAKEVLPVFASKLNLTCSKPDIKEIKEKCELVFLALPHTASIDIASKLFKAGLKVVDLSADFRFKDLKVYSKFYGVNRKNSIETKRVVYGIPELNKSQIKSASLIANPGCYPTPAILSLAPLIKANLIDLSTIVIDAKSGVSGAGRKKAEEFFLASNFREDFKAYKVGTHQHTPEIEQELTKIAKKKVKVVFVPHLLPVERGILETIYVQKNKSARKRFKGINVVNLFKSFYKDEPFIRIKKEGEYPSLKDVVNTNFCDIGIRQERNSFIIVSAIDNLVKGASGQAVQNMNIMFGFSEIEGLL